MVVSRANELSERVLGVGRDQTASNVRKLKRYLVSLLLVVSVSAVRTQCRTSGAALFCTGQFERPIGFKGDTNYVRDWDRKCPISSVVECVILFARGMDCQDVTDPCGLQAYKVNSILCHKVSEFFFFFFFSLSLFLVDDQEIIIIIIIIINKNNNNNK